MEAIHDGKRFPCTFCEYQASQKGHLKEHIKSKHEGQIFQSKGRQGKLADSDIKMKGEYQIKVENS